MLNFKPFQRLSSAQWWWLWSAYWRLWPALLRIKLKQGDWLKAKLSFVDEPMSTTATASIAPDAQALQMQESVRLAARLHFLRADCLPKSIVLSDMLSARFYNAHSVIGVSKAGHRIASHAWVEVDGVMLGEPESVASDFTSLGR